MANDRAISLSLARLHQRTDQSFLLVATEARSRFALTRSWPSWTETVLGRLLGWLTQSGLAHMCDAQIA